MIRDTSRTAAEPDAPEPRHQPGPRLWNLALWVGVLCAAVVFVDLGGYSLQSPDEGRYAEASREMLELGDWVVPRFGYIERVNKPPLVYWVTAASFAVFGVQEWSARLGPALAAVAGAFVVFVLGRSMFGIAAGAASAIVLLTSAWYALLGRTLVTDMLLCLFLTLAMAAFWWALRSRAWGHYELFFVAAAAATLTKGPVGVALPGLIGVLYLTAARQWRAVAWEKLLLGLVIYALLAAPWFMAVQARYPGFLRYAFVGENLERFAGKYHADYPIYFYVPVVLLGLFPWTFAFLAAAWRGVRPPTTDEGAKWGGPALFLWIWFGVVIAFFSLSRGKLPTYVLPCFPPLALLIGRAWPSALEAGAPGDATAWQRRSTGWLALGLLVLTAALLVVGAGLPGLTAEQRRAAVAWVGGSLVLGFAACLVALRQGSARAHFTAPVIASVLFIVGLVQGAGIVLGAEDVTPLAERVARLARPGDHIVTFYASKAPSFRFYLGRALGSSHRLTELPPPPRPDIQGAATTAAAEGSDAQTRILMAMARSGHGLFCLIKESQFEQLREELAAAGCDIVLARRRSQLLITNRRGISEWNGSTRN